MKAMRYGVRTNDRERFYMIAVINRLPVKDGAAEQVVERFANSRGNVQGFPGFVSMEVLNSEAGDEVLVITRWRDREAFDSWVGSDAFKKAHGRSGGGDLLRGHPQMGAYEVAVEREPGPPGDLA
jgi:heme oxygenase (staphylobilin-producing)